MVAWLEDNIPEYANMLGYGHRFTYIFAAYLMIAPSLQAAYFIENVKFQLYLLQNLLENLNMNYEDFSANQLVFNDDYQNEIKNRLIFCLKRHQTFVNVLWKWMMSNIYIYFFAVAGTLLGTSIVLFFLLVIL